MPSSSFYMCLYLHIHINILTCTHSHLHNTYTFLCNMTRVRKVLESSSTSEITLFLKYLWMAHPKLGHLYYSPSLDGLENTAEESSIQWHVSAISHYSMKSVALSNGIPALSLYTIPDSGISRRDRVAHCSPKREACHTQCSERPGSSFKATGT